MTERHRPTPDNAETQPIHMPDSWFKAFVDANTRFTFLEPPLKIKVGNEIVRSLATGEMTPEQVKATTFSPAQAEQTIAKVTTIHNYLDIPVPDGERYSAFWEAKKQTILDFVTNVQTDGHDLGDLAHLYDAANTSLKSDLAKTIGTNNRKRLEAEIAAKKHDTEIANEDQQAKRADMRLLENHVLLDVAYRASQKQLPPELTQKFLTHIFS